MSGSLFCLWGSTQISRIFIYSLLLVFDALISPHLASGSPSGWPGSVDTLWLDLARALLYGAEVSRSLGLLFLLGAWDPHCECLLDRGHDPDVLICISTASRPFLGQR